MEEETDAKPFVVESLNKTEKKDADECKINWTKEEDENLKILIRNFGKNWKTIASFLPGRTELQCMCRWKTNLDPRVAKETWTKEEDEKLAELVNKYGIKNWTAVAKQLKGRMGKHCRERWFAHLDPVFRKSSFTDEEDIIIYKAHCILGNRWSEIAQLLPGRSELSVESHWNNSVKHRVELGLFKDKVDVVSLDIQQFVEGEVDFRYDVVIDSEPVIPQVVRCENAKRQQEEKEKRATGVETRQSLASKRDLSSPSPSLPRSSSSSPSSVAAPPAVQLDQKQFVEAALRMIAEDMLPLSFVEGVGFRSFMSAISPERSRLSQRVMGIQLYEDVERTIKPQLIRELKAPLSKIKDGQGAIHVTCDLWAGDGSRAGEDAIFVVQLHFVSEFWQIRRPVVAYRHLSHKNLSSAVAKELEDVLLSYGIFPRHIGYILTNQAKEILAGNNQFCDYKIVCSPNRGEPDGDDILAFLSDQNPETESMFSKVLIGTRATCVARTLQLVIKDALKNSRVVENVLSQIHNVVAFFRSSAYWSEVLLKEGNVSLCPSSSNCRWNSMMLSLRRMVHDTTWSTIMTLLAQARIEATDAASAPPLIMVKREQVADILGLLEPFEEALQILQGSGVTVSFIIPSLVSLDKALERRVTNYAHFCKALRCGLHTHFQSLLHQRDVILATVLDPRLKLQPFPDNESKDKEDFLSPPSKSKAEAIVLSYLDSCSGAGSTPVECKEQKKQDGGAENEARSESPSETKASDGSSDDNCDVVNVCGTKRRSAADILPPPAKLKKMSEDYLYLSEPALENGSSLLYWKSAAQFSQLRELARKLLAAPATSGGFDRLYPMATCIVRSRRNRLPAHTTERLLLYRNALKSRTAAAAKQVKAK